MGGEKRLGAKSRAKEQIWKERERKLASKVSNTHIYSTHTLLNRQKKKKINVHAHMNTLCVH